MTEMPNTNRPPFSKVLQMLDDVENQQHAAVVATLLNAALVIRKVMGIQGTFTSADIQQIARHYKDHTQPQLTPAEQAIEDSLR